MFAEMYKKLSLEQQLEIDKLSVHDEATVPRHILEKHTKIIWDGLNEPFVFITGETETHFQADVLYRDRVFSSVRVRISLEKEHFTTTFGTTVYRILKFTIQNYFRKLRGRSKP